MTIGSLRRRIDGVFRRCCAAALLTLVCAATAAAQTAPDDLKPAKDVIAALDKKDYAKARALAEELKDPLHKKALRWRLAQVKDVSYGFGELAEIYRAVKDWPGAARIAERADDAIGNGDTPEALSQLCYLVPSASGELFGADSPFFNFSNAGIAGYAGTNATCLGIDDKVTKLVYFTQPFTGFTFALSFAPDDTQDTRNTVDGAGTRFNNDLGQNSENFSVAANYERDIGGEWTHLAGVRDGKQLKLYVNGKLSAVSDLRDGPAFDLSNDKPLWIGFGAQNFFTGAMSDVRLYDGPLSDDDVAKLAE